jgi:nuclear pore complex protein Nup54
VIHYICHRKNNESLFPGIDGTANLNFGHTTLLTMVTWGTNQVFTFGGAPSSQNAPPPAPSFGSAVTNAPTPLFGGSTPAPGPPTSGLFGSNPPASSTSNLFGSTTTGGLFGANASSSGSANGAPTPATGSLFGAPAQSSGGLFGTPSPASGGLFGNTSTSTGGLFGAPNPAPGGLFGNSTPGGLFGNPAPTSGGLFASNNQMQSPAPAIPAQAALQAHMDASARQEAARVQSLLEELYHAYTGNCDKKSSPLIAIVYNNMTSEQLQWQFTNQQAGGGYVLPPKPPQIDEKQWWVAVVNNPDPSRYIPVALVGAEALQARLGWQQQQATQYSQNLGLLREAHDQLQQRTNLVSQAVSQLDHLLRVKLRIRLLRLMNQVELIRCMNLPLQADEFQLSQRFHQVLKQIETLNKSLAELQATVASSMPTPISNSTNMPDPKAMQDLLHEHKRSLLYLDDIVKKEKRDIQLLQERIKAR